MSKLVLIDDNPRVLAQYEDILKTDGSITVVGTASDGKQGLTLVQRKEPDLVLLDIVMPRMDGLAFLRELSVDEPGRFKPSVIVVSAVGQESVVEQAFALGARFYLMKPFDPAVLLERIHQITDGMGASLLSDQVSTYHVHEEPKQLEERVSDILHELGVPAHIRGYQYLRDAIMMTIENQEILNSVTKVLYPAVARMNTTTPTRVERSIRHAIELSWERGRKDTLEDLFGDPAGGSSRKPTNSEYIALISDRIRVRYHRR